MAGDRGTERRRWPRALAWWLAALTGLILSLLSQGMLIEDGAPDPLIGAVMAAEALAGGGSLALLPRVLARRGAVASAVVALAGAATALGTPAALIAVALTAAARRARRTLVVGLSCVAGALASTLIAAGGRIAPAQIWPSLGAGAAAVLVAALIGLQIGAREERLRALAERAELSDAIQAARIGQGRAEERARIAREMHDALGHDLSLLSLYAGALETRDDLAPEAVRDTAGTIRRLAARSGRDLREILGVLHDTGPGDQASATWRDVGEVVDQARGGGAEVAVSLPGTWEASAGEAFDALPQKVRHTVLRVIQESLTNARRHAPGAPVGLSIADGGDALVVELDNPSPPGGDRGASPAGSGLGLAGLHERLRLVGGRLEAGESGGSFRIRAWVPRSRPGEADAP
jgi:signal transduction histidine kinase